MQKKTKLAMGESLKLELDNNSAIDYGAILRASGGGDATSPAYMTQIPMLVAQASGSAPQVTSEAWAKASQTFGTMRHIDTAQTLFLEAKAGILNLRDQFKLDSPEQTLFKRIAAYVEGLYNAADADTDVLQQYFGDYMEQTNGQWRLKEDVLDDFTEPDQETTVKDDNGADITVKHNAHTALFATGRIMRNDIRRSESIRGALVRWRRFQQKRLRVKQGELAEVKEQLPAAFKRLFALNRTRLESLGDYHAAQQLVSENWATVEQQYADRRRTLESHKGLYYVRVRETPFSAELASPRPLRYASADDLVPGCPSDEPLVELPESLDEFFESVLEIPAASWLALHDKPQLLPGRLRIDGLLQQRTQRLQARANIARANGTPALLPRLAGLQTQNLGLRQNLLRLQLPQVSSLLDFQRASLRVLSLEDLLSNRSAHLHHEALTLRSRLLHATGCLLDKLSAISPSLRLSWAQAAEDDRLPVDQPEHWPGLELAEQADFNGTRTLIELVRWQFRQLAATADDNAKSALRNLIRACLLVAANDDPADILHGRLQTLPGRLAIGEALRLDLNREALPGTALQLMDSGNRVIGQLRVDDHDEQGAVATITAVYQAAVTPSLAFTVSGIGR